MFMGSQMPYGVSLHVALYMYLCQFNREAFAPHLEIDELPAHRFIQSIHNITIERGWLRLRLQWGDNVKVFWEVGAGIYNESDPNQ
jgi:hypothetical protein